MPGKGYPVYLAVRIVGQLFHALNCQWHHVPGQLLPAGLDEVFCMYLGIQALQYQQDRLAQSQMGSTHRRQVGVRARPVSHRLDFPGADTLARCLDHGVHAAQEIVIALLVLAHQVSGPDSQFI